MDVVSPSTIPFGGSTEVPIAADDAVDFSGAEMSAPLFLGLSCADSANMSVFVSCEQNICQAQYAGVITKCVRRKRPNSENKHPDQVAGIANWGMTRTSR